MVGFYDSTSGTSGTYGDSIWYQAISHYDWEEMSSLWKLIRYWCLFPPIRRPRNQRQRSISLIIRSSELRHIRSTLMHRRLLFCRSGSLSKRIRHIRKDKQ